MELNQTQILIVIGSLIGLLLLFPLVMVIVLQRLLPAPSEAPVLASDTVDTSGADFEGLSDFWQAMLPHLIELRSRLVRAVGAVLLGMIVGFVLVLPQGPVDLVRYIINEFACLGRTPPCVQAVATPEAFVSYMTVALTIGVILGMPVIVYQLIAFIAPGLTNTEKRYVYAAIPFITSFFLAGILFGWFISVPAALQFLLNFGDPTVIEIMPSLREFISTFTILLLINGLVFELPLIIYVLALVGGVTPEFLAKNRRYALLIIVVVAAVITPTGDPLNLALVAGPMYVLFEFGIILARFAPKRPQPTQA